MFQTHKFAAVKFSSYFLYLFASLFLIGSQLAPFSFDWLDYQTIANLIVEESECDEKETENEVEEREMFSQSLGRPIDINELSFDISGSLTTHLPTSPFLERPCPPPDLV